MPYRSKKWGQHHLVGKQQNFGVWICLFRKTWVYIWPIGTSHFVSWHFQCLLTQFDFWRCSVSTSQKSFLLPGSSSFSWCNIINLYRGNLCSLRYFLRNVVPTSLLKSNFSPVILRDRFSSSFFSSRTSTCSLKCFNSFPQKGEIIRKSFIKKSFIFFAKVQHTIFVIKYEEKEKIYQILSTDNCQ